MDFKLPQSNLYTDYPLSIGQKSLWLTQLLNPLEGVYNVHLVWKVPNSIKVVELKKAIKLLYFKHPALRSTFHESDGEPFQRVWNHVELNWVETHNDEGDTDFFKLIRKELGEPFDLSKQSSKWHLYHRSNNELYLVFFIHHIAGDFWSYIYFLDDLRKAYNFLEHSIYEPLNLLDHTFEQHRQLQTEYLSSERGKSDEAFWREKLREMPPSLDLPFDRPRPTHLACNVDYLKFDINSELFQATKRMAKSQQTSLFTLYFAVFHLLMHRYSNQQDICIGTPTAGRENGYETVFGHFANPVLVRHKHELEENLADFLAEFSENVNTALKHRRFPLFNILEKLVSFRELSRSSLFQLSFSWENISNFDASDNPIFYVNDEGIRHWDMGPLGQWEHVIWQSQIDDQDLVLRICKFGSTVKCVFHYNTDLFDAESITEIKDNFLTLLTSCSRVGNLQKPLHRLNWANSSQARSHLTKSQTLSDANNETGEDTQMLLSELTHTPERFEEQIACIYKGERLSYAALEHRANQVANYLVQQGIQTGDIVALAFSRSETTLIVFKALLKIGATYLPIDTSLPTDRIRYILSDANPKIILCNQSFANQLSSNHYSTQLIQTVLDESATYSNKVDGTPFSTIEDAETHTAYIIYTSGTTGHPKGVSICYAALNHLVQEQRRDIPTQPEDRVLLFASLGFDASIFCIVAALQAHATLVIPASQQTLGEELEEVINEHQITWALLPPSLLTTMSPQQVSCLKTLIVGGEALPQRTLDLWAPNRQFFNAYGPTEATVWSTSARLRPGDQPHIGEAVKGRDLYVLDQYQRPVATGVVGELYIGGQGLSSGYLNSPELTEEHFVELQLYQNPPARLYRTGDLVKQKRSGKLEFIGRNDDQLKINGYRIEPGEIKNRILATQLIKDCVVVAQKVNPTQTKLIAFYIPIHRAGKEESGSLAMEILADLKQQLPKYMLPHAFVPMEKFPLTSNDKVDFKALPFPLETTTQNEAAPKYPPRNELERRIANIWCELLGKKDVGIHDSFFDLGGHSLLLPKAVSRINNELNIKIPLQVLFKHPSIYALCKHLEEEAQLKKQGATQEKNPGLHSDNNFSTARHASTESHPGDAIAVIGLSGRFPGADTPGELWQLLCDEREGIETYSPQQLNFAKVPPEIFNKPNFVPRAGRINHYRDFDARFFSFTPREAQITDPQQRVFLECAWEALEDAAQIPENYKGSIGIYAGSGVNRYYTEHLIPNDSIKSAMGDYPLLIANDKDFLCSRAAYKLNLHGPTVVVQTACSTSLVAIHMAADALKNQECDMAIAGGISLGCESTYGYEYEAGMILSADGRCRPFDKNAGGTVPGQGAALVVLKRLEDALKDKDHIYAVLIGSAINNDGAEKIGYTAPSSEGQSQVIQEALARANVPSDTIDFVETHGTATQLGDPIEFEALVANYSNSNDEDHSVHLGAIKSNIGHLDAASGAAGFIKSVLSLYHKQIPATAHFEQGNPNLPWSNSSFQVDQSLTPWPETNHPPRAAVSSFGIGGTNAHAILESAERYRQTSNEDKVVLSQEQESTPEQIFCFSAKSPESLKQTLSNYQNLSAILNSTSNNSFQGLATKSDLPSLKNLAYTLAVGRRAFEYRLQVTANSSQALENQLRKYCEESTAMTPIDQQEPGVFFLFPGQGAQYRGMANQLYQQCNYFRKIVDSCITLLSEHQQQNPRNTVITAYDVIGLTDEINQTQLTQPALFIIEYALAKTLIHWGIKPLGMIGHSIGEFTAATLAGVFSLDDALELVALRGRLIQSLSTGAMMALKAPLKRALNLIHDFELKHPRSKLSIAAINSEQQTIVAGDILTISAFHTFTQKEKIESTRLKTSHAFHSHMMDSIVPVFAKAIAKKSLSAPKICYFSTQTGEEIKDEEATSPDFWANQLRATVNYKESILNIKQDIKATHNIFLEVGPGSVLTGLNRTLLHGNNNHLFNTIGNAPNKQWLSIKTTLGQLWQLGCTVNWQNFYESETVHKLSLPTYAFDRQEYWIEKATVRAQPEFEEQLLNDELIAQHDTEKTASLNESGEESTQHDSRVDVSNRQPSDDLILVSDLEKSIAEQWQISLGVSIQKNSDFFELGGDSLTAIKLLDRINKQFALQLPSEALLQSPNFCDFANLLQNALNKPTEQKKDAAVSNLVKIKGGSSNATPIVMIHPIGGEVYYYRDLARYLGPNEALYGFQAPSLTGLSAPMESIQELASLYLKELQKVVSDKPYVLGGASFGGLVAAEMAQQLVDSKHLQPPNLLALIDSPAPGGMPTSLADSAEIIHYLFKDQLQLSLAELRELPLQHQLNAAFAASSEEQEIPPHLSEAYFNTWIAHQNAMQSYKLQEYQGDVIYFKHAESMEGFPDNTHYPWIEKMVNSIEIHRIPGNHISMNYAPNVSVIARWLRTRIESMVNGINLELRGMKIPNSQV